MYVYSERCKFIGCSSCSTLCSHWHEMVSSPCVPDHIWAAQTNQATLSLLFSQTVPGRRAVASPSTGVAAESAELGNVQKHQTQRLPGGKGMLTWRTSAGVKGLSDTRGALSLISSPYKTNQHELIAIRPLHLILLCSAMHGPVGLWWWERGPPTCQCWPRTGWFPCCPREETQLSTNNSKA